MSVSVYVCTYVCAFFVFYIKGGVFVVVVLIVFLYNG